MFNRPYRAKLKSKPNEVFLDACTFLAKKLEEQGFRYQKSTKSLIKDDNAQDFEFILDFGTSTRNRQGALINFNVHFVIKSTMQKDNRKSLFLAKGWGDPDDIVTNRGLGYLTSKSDYASGSWNLLNVNPAEILRTIEQVALPRFNKFNQLDEVMRQLRNGQMKEFGFDFQKLDFLLCFGGEHYVSECLNGILSKKGWHSIFNEKLSQLRSGEDIDKSQGLISQLVHRADFYNISI